MKKDSKIYSKGRSPLGGEQSSLRVNSDPRKGRSPPRKGRSPRSPLGGEQSLLKVNSDPRRGRSPRSPQQSSLRVNSDPCKGRSPLGGEQSLLKVNSDPRKGRSPPRGVRVHFVGIGGIGMCGLAELLFHSGSLVTGSDLVESVQTRHLRDLGISVVIGHRESNVGGVDIVIQSAAVSLDNVEIRVARKKKIPVIKRSEALAEVMRLKRGLVTAGTHGKTTTAHFLSQILIHNKKDPTVVLGGRSHLFQSTVFPGRGEWFIAESDESDGGFRYLSPEVAVITNIDRDHLDYYGSFENLKQAFLNFVLRVPFYGCVIACGDDKVLRGLLTNIKQKVIFYGFNQDNHFVLEKLSLQKYKVFSYVRKGSSVAKGKGGVSVREAFAYGEGDLRAGLVKKEVGVLSVPLPGMMNALNALAACVAGVMTGLSFEECLGGFSQFKGVGRRFQKKGTRGGIEFYDDYAHHPTEVRAVLSAFREKFGKDKNLVVLFQPHRFSRTEDCWKNFLTCFDFADRVFLADIYSAGESSLPGISSEKLAKEIKHSSCVYCSEGDIFSLLPKVLKREDIFITMGAGSVYKYGEQLMSKFD